MAESRLRRQIAYEAARLMYERQEAEYYRAKQKAARRLGQSWIKPADLPSNREIRDEIQTLARMFEGEQRSANLRQMRVEALRIMRLLSAFRPRLIGSVLTGHIRRGSDIDVHLFSDNLSTIKAVLELHGLAFEVEHKAIRQAGTERVFTHVHLHERFHFELTVYATALANYPFTSSITGKPIERASIRELETLLATEYPALSVEEALLAAEQTVDRFQVYRLLLMPLESVKQPVQFHPEGDALYHSLQVFDLACCELPYDEEFLLAALLHDVGKAIDPRDHVAAALEALDGAIGERTAWLIEHHMEGHALRDGTLGARATRRLRESEYFDELLLLAQCDRAGRAQGVEASELDEAIDYLRELAESNGE